VATISCTAAGTFLWIDCWRDGAGLREPVCRMAGSSSSLLVASELLPAALPLPTWTQSWHYLDMSGHIDVEGTSGRHLHRQTCVCKTQKHKVSCVLLAPSVPLCGAAPPRAPEC
jgi:hypothetical protein